MFIPNGINILIYIYNFKKLAISLTSCRRPDYSSRNMIHFQYKSLPVNYNVKSLLEMEQLFQWYLKC